MNRNDILKKFREEIEAGKVLLGTGAGMGLSAKIENVAGVNFITTSANDYFVIQARGNAIDYLPICDVNSLIMDIAPEITSMAGNTPVFAGIYGNDTFRNMEKYLKDVKEAGYSGIFNSPSMDEMDGYAKNVHDSVKIDYQKEVELMRVAKKLDFFTAGVCYTASNAKAMALAGIDMIIAKVPTWSEYTKIEDKKERLDIVSRKMQEIVDKAIETQKEILIVALSDLIEEPEDLEYIYYHTKGLNGFIGTLSIEARPVGKAIREQIAAFKSASY